MKRHLLLVEWWDHSSNSSWQTEDEVEEAAARPLLARSVGWLVTENAAQLALAGRVCDGSACGLGNVQVILKKAIRSRRVLRRGEK